MQAYSPREEYHRNLQTFVEGVIKMLDLGQGEIEQGATPETLAVWLHGAEGFGITKNRQGIVFSYFGEDSSRDFYFNAVPTDPHFPTLDRLYQRVREAARVYPPDLRHLASRLQQSLRTGQA